MVIKQRAYRKPVLPTAASVAFSRNLIRQLGDDDGPRFVLKDTEADLNIEIDETVFEALRQILIAFALNRPISLVPLDHELTTHQAADLLNVSRGYVLKLIEAKELPHRMVGTHRRIRLEDLLAYKEKARAKSDKAMDDLAAISQELGME
jgi:excisionase family DNA binding protein